MKKNNHSNVLSTKSDENLRNKIIEYWSVDKNDLVAPKDRVQRDERNLGLGLNGLRSLIVEHAEKMDDAEGQMELLPDLYLVEETLVSSILSPKDLKDATLNITLDKGAPPEIAEIIKQHFTKEFNLAARLNTIVKEALFEKGSYVLLTLPPAVISNLIKKNTYGAESISSLSNADEFRNIGLLKSKKENSYVMEGMYNVVNDKNEKVIGTKLLHLTDNPRFLLQANINHVLEKREVDDVLINAYGLEALTNVFRGGNQGDTGKGNEAQVYNNRVVKNVLSCILDDEITENSKLNPLVLTIPQESIVPVHVPGDPSNHVGYYIFLDEEGNPIQYRRNTNKYKELSRRLNEKVEQQALSAVVNIGISYNTTNTQRTNTLIEQNKALMEAYFVQFEKELKTAITKKGKSDTVEISNPGELYRIMFYRQLERQQTRILYVPARQITYFAFNYDDHGVGISLLEKTKLYGSFRAILTFAMVMAAIKASVNRTILEITLDEQDPDPIDTVEKLLTEYSLMQTSGIASGSTFNPVDIITGLKQAGTQVKVNGGDKYPGTSIDVTEHKREITPPDQSIMDLLQKVHYAGLWISVETVDSSVESEFAAGIQASNLNQDRRIQGCQDKLITIVSNFMQDYIRLGGPLLTKIKEKFDEYSEANSLTIDEIITSIRLSLPKADTAVLKEQLTDYVVYSELIEKAIEAYISEDAFRDTLSGENIAANIPDFKNSVLNLLKRQYLRSENMLPELDTLLASEDSKLVESLNQHNETLVGIIGDILRAMKKVENEDDLKTKGVVDSLTPLENNEEDSDINSTDEGDEFNEDLDMSSEENTEDNVEDTDNANLDDTINTEDESEDIENPDKDKVQDKDNTDDDSEVDVITDEEEEDEDTKEK